MANKWIQKAIKNKGALHRQLGVSQEKKIPTTSQEFSGLIDEVAVFSRALSPQEISQYYSEKEINCF